MVILKDKITGIEAKTTPLASVEGSSIKRLQNLPGKELEKVKSEKRLADRKGNSWNKKQEDLTKETNGSKEQTGKTKERETNKVVKKDVKVPARNKVPAHRNEAGNINIPKGSKPVISKQVKQESKPS